ncbi:hypothetical protein [Pseudomonas frederiksbergensis]|uniref:hypothetical protein n=1 Tax=Pseudomonas frederiksbergensis TaxID=104087 RepID=UPI003D24EF73
MKPNLAIFTAIVASAASMAQANATINIKSSSASQDAKAFAKAQLSKFEHTSLIDKNIVAMSEAFRIDDQPLNIDMRQLMAAIDGGDSTIQNIYNPAASNCYTNCYKNCHGSRSWR